MDGRSASAAERVCDCGEGVQWPNERKPIFFMGLHPADILDVRADSLFAQPAGERRSAIGLEPFLHRSPRLVRYGRTFCRFRLSSAAISDPEESMRSVKPK